MQMRPEVQIASMIKAMSDTVLPAIDPANKLAMEQGQLVVGMLKLMSAQLPLQFRFDRDELARLLATSRELCAAPVTTSGLGGALRDLAGRQTAAAAVLERCSVDPAALLSEIRALRHAIGALVPLANSEADGPARDRIEGAILAMSRDQLLRDRALVKLQGWEPDPAAIPEIGELLSTSTAGP